MAQIEGPPLISYSDADASGRRHELVGSLASGAVMRLWHGVYLDRSLWESTDREGRHRLRMDALRQSRGDDYVFCDESAAVVWGLPLIPARLEAVTVIAPTDEGGRSRGGLIKRATTVERAVTEIDGTAVTTAAQTVIDLARRLPFAEGLGVVDHALRSTLVTPDDLDERMHAFRSSRGARRARRVLSLGDARAESLLESLSRGAMIDMGAEPDELQRPVIDSSGRVSRGDFWWERARLIGECDGRAKYEYGAYTRGRTAGEVLWEEKRREDAMRATGISLARWGWYEATRPADLARVLRSAGLSFGR